MCGIAGKLNFDPAASINRERLAAMTAVVAHRGPDADGFYVAPGLGLGHRRLSIIDLSTGDQPLANEDGTVWVVFNGEIYNFREIRFELEHAGHRFRTRTDTEVIVHAYEQWGDEAVHRFRGMFAFAIWDEPRRRLLLVRDRLGIKPVYYSVTPTGLTFGSEIKSLLEDPEVARDWSAEALDSYLTLLYVPSPRTIYRHIDKLAPGHLLVAQNGHVTVRRYWDLAFTGDGDPAREEEYLDRLEALVDEAVRIRLLSDVPLGAFLSGGVDSSAVVAAMVRAAPSRVLTSAVGFDEDGFSELEHARAVAAHLGCDIHEKIVRPDAADLLPKVAWHFDEPFADSSAIPTYYVSAAARERVTVALSGDGGDELWAGYARHSVEHWEARARRLLGKRGGSLAGSLANWIPLAIKGARSLRHLALTPADACARKHAYGQFEADARSAVYHPDFTRSIEGADPLDTFRSAYDACPSPDPIDRALYVDVKTYLVDDILTKVDKMSMAVSLEARVPLLDHRLLEFASTVPAALKLRNGRRKYLLRRLLERRIPKSIVDRPKHGFTAPIHEWLRGPLASMAADLFFDGRLRSRGVLDERAVARMWHEHRNGTRDHRHRLWSVLMLELWFRQFVDRPTQHQALPHAAA
jgi:asparagine synthase (glutamine-hydrolysing)